MRTLLVGLATMIMATGCTTRQARYLNEYLRDSHMDVRPTGNEAVLREMRELRAEQQAMKADLTDLRSLGNAQAADAHGREAATPQPAVSTPQRAVEFPPDAVFRVWCVPGCAPCEANLTDFDAAGVKYTVVRDVSRHPRWVLDRVRVGEGYPFVEWHTPNNKWMVKSGRMTSAQLLASYQASLSADAAVRYGSHPLSSQWYGNREGLIQHLLNDMNHRGKFKRSQLDRLTDAELWTLHDDDHAGFVRYDRLGASLDGPQDADQATQFSYVAYSAPAPVYGYQYSYSSAPDVGSASGGFVGWVRESLFGSRAAQRAQDKADARLSARMSKMSARSDKRAVRANRRSSTTVRAYQYRTRYSYTLCPNC